ncbi:MAG TPA: extracellular solute-binding protein [Gemmataceae bacterium]
MQLKCRRGSRILPVLAAAALTAPAGCDLNPSLAPPERTKPLAGRTVRVACPDPVMRQILERHGRIWSAETGATLAVEDVPFADAPSCDLGVIAPVDFARLAEAGQLEPVPPRLQEPGPPYHWSTVLPVYRDKLLAWGREVLALPVVGEGRVFVYRSDLFADRAHRDAFREKHGRDLAPPVTWEDVEACAAYFTEALGRPALPPLPAGAEALEQAFFTVAAPYDRQEFAKSELIEMSRSEEQAAALFSFHYDLQTVQPRLTAPAFVHALEWFRRTRPYRPPQPADDPSGAFRDGTAVMGVVPLAALAEFQAEGSEVRDRFGIARLPGAEFYFEYRTGRKTPLRRTNHMPYLGGGGWLGVVRKGSPEAEAAFDLLAYLGTPETSAEIVSNPAWGAGPTRSTHTDTSNRGYWLGYRLDEERTGQLLEALRAQNPTALGNPVARLRTPTAPEHIRALAEVLRPAITEGGDALAALREAKAAWRKLDEPLPEGELRRLYRLSLSLER